jgi:hypothetical protein
LWVLVALWWLFGLVLLLGLVKLGSVVEVCSVGFKTVVVKCEESDIDDYMEWDKIFYVVCAIGKR